jgi:hypothetical protein
MQFQNMNMILHPSLGSHIENIHQINQYSNRTTHRIVINHINNTPTSLMNTNLSLAV